MYCNILLISGIVIYSLLVLPLLTHKVEALRVVSGNSTVSMHTHLIFQKGRKEMFWHMGEAGLHPCLMLHIFAKAKYVKKIAI